MKKILLSSLLFTLPLPMLSLAASFDCTKAASATEKLICSDEKISALDEQLAKSYKAALEQATNKDAFKKTQVEWIRQQRACENTDCLAQLYETRINALNNPSNDAVPPAVNGSSTNQDTKKPLIFKLVFGDSYPLCQPYVDMLNKTKYTEYPVCERKILPEFSQFKELQWIEITDKKEMKKIMERNVTMSFKGAGNTNERQILMGIKNTSDGIENNQIRLYATNIDLDSNGILEKTYKSVGAREDAKKYNACEYPSVFYVDDETQIDGDVHKKYREKGYDLINNPDTSFMIFNGKVYKTWWSGKNFKYDITINEIDSAGTQLCGINIK